MKIIIKLLIFNLFLVIFIATTTYATRSGYLNIPIKHGVEYYLRFNKIKAKINNLAIKNHQITIDYVEIYENSSLFRLENILINNDLDLDYSNSYLNADINIGKFSVIQNGQECLNAELKAIYNGYIAKNRMDLKVSIANLFYQYIDHDGSKINLGEGKINIIYNRHGQKIDYDLQAKFEENKTATIRIKNDGSLFADIAIKNLPITLYKPLYYLDPTDKLLVFLNDFIKDGVIESSQIRVNLSEQDLQTGNYNKDNISGTTRISNLKMLYNPDFPPLSRMEMDVIQKGLLTEFIIDQAYSSEILIRDGLILMDWKGLDDTALVVKAKGKGPIKSLTDFISPHTHKNLQKAAIDLTKFSNVAELDIKIFIPLKPGTVNDYDITVVIPKTDLAIFNDRIILQNAAISGKYNGDSLKLVGKGKINGFDSSLAFDQNFVDQDQDLAHKERKEQFDHKLSITTDINVADGDKIPKKFGFFTIVNGKARINFEYINLNDDGKILLDSDLKNLEFYFDKTGIHKMRGQKADLLLKGLLDSPTHGKIDFKLAGNNNLDVSGKIIIEDTQTEITIVNLNHKNTKLSGKIVSRAATSDVSVEGRMLDLSNMDMMQFLEKEKDAGNKKITLNIAKLKLKNNITADNFNLRLECDKTKCYNGKIVAQIDRELFEGTVKEEGLREKWVIQSGNSGELLKGIGAYDNMKGGNMLLVITTDRKQAETGEIIPVLNGTFEFERFALNKTSTLTKLISFVSLPGFFNMISGNHNITFAEMNGKFSFQNGILNVSDCKAVGVFLSFTMQGKIDTNRHKINLRGSATPALYGLTAAIGIVPVIGRLLTGDKYKAGLLSAPYQIKDSY